MCRSIPRRHLSLAALALVAVSLFASGHVSRPVQLQTAEVVETLRSARDRLA
jgi:hypothetical protein